MKLRDTLTGQKKKLPKRIRLFVCGPTVYDFSHVGHARTYLFYDILVNYLRQKGFKVFYLQNITNVDAKIINRAKEKNISPKNLARRFEKEYFKDNKNLNIKSVTKFARASDYIKEIQNQISELIKKRFAYQTKNGIYFEVKKFKDYGKLSHQNIKALKSGYRIEPDPEKKETLDFALWKFAPKNSYGWDSPWGFGLPGWHIEDTAIAKKIFGLTYEMHGGAAELKFPHHEAEIAQARTLSGKKFFVKIWVHTGVLLVNGQKMSKSLKNFVTIREFLKKHSAEALRLLVFGTHYSSPINYTEDLAEECEKAFNDLMIFLKKLEIVSKINPEKTKSKIGFKALAFIQKKIDKAIEDDFKTPETMALVFKLIKDVQPKIWTLDSDYAKKLQKFITRNLEIFGFRLNFPKIPKKIDKIAKVRELFRRNRQFVQADDLRKKINGLGYIIEDTPRGYFTWPTENKQSKNQL